MVCFHLEYCIQFCSLYLKIDMAEIEGVQRQVITVITGMEKCSSRERDCLPLREMNKRGYDKRTQNDN